MIINFISSMLGAITGVLVGNIIVIKEKEEYEKEYWEDDDE